MHLKVNLELRLENDNALQMWNPKVQKNNNNNNNKDNVEKYTQFENLNKQIKIGTSQTEEEKCRKNQPKMVYVLFFFPFLDKTLVVVDEECTDLYALVYFCTRNTNNYKPSRKLIKTQQVHSA